MSVVAGVIIGAVAGAIGGLGQAMASDVEYKEKLKGLNRKRDDLTASYNQAVEQTTDKARDTITEIGANIADTKLSQGIGLRTSANNMVMQEEIQNQQIAELQIQAADARGAAIQGVATSGVRLMRDADGNIVNAGVRRTELASDRSYALAKAQRDISRFQNLESARANYYSADRQMASYGRQIQYTQNELQRTLEKHQLAYEQEYNELTYDIDYMNDKSFTGGWTQHWLSNVFNVLSLGMNGAAQGLSTYKEGKGYLWD